jgi:hypothetical protein
MNIGARVGGTLVQDSALDPEVKGSNSAVGNELEKTEKKYENGAGYQQRKIQYSVLGPVS